MTLIYAHRGASGEFPENTLLAFRQALEAGVAGIELDVHATADRVPVVIHDRELARTTDGRGLVDELTLVELEALNAGNGQRVPRLADVLALVGDRLHLDIEVKGAGIEREVLETLAGFPSARWAISSFDWETLRRLRVLSASAELWPLAERVDDYLFAIAAELGSPMVALYHQAYTPVSATALRGAVLMAMVWTVNDPEEALRVCDLGVAAICSDVPGRIAAALDGH